MDGCPLAAALLLALSLLLWLPASAAEVYFTAVNNTLLALEDENMPVNVNGTIYVPYTVFNSLELGTYAIYSYSSQTVVILQGELELYYDMSRGMTYDQDNTELAFKAVFRKGKVYVPAYATSQFFGLRYAYITDSAYGEHCAHHGGQCDGRRLLCPFRRGDDAGLPDQLPAQCDPDGDAAGGERDAAPQCHPDAVLWGYGDLIRPSSAWTRWRNRSWRCLSNMNLRTCFFLTAADIMDNPDLVRQICGRGHSVGLLLGEPLEAQYAQAAALLFEAAAYQTQLVALDGQATADSLSAAAGAWFESMV